MIDPYKTMKFYDPLYKVITIKPYIKESFGMRKYWESSLGDPQDDGLVENIVTRIMGCREIARLNFLRQSGPAFLVFPSSTHTRFAHSLGTYYLGLEALERCWVEDGNRKIPLKNWIDNRGKDKLGWRDEFLLALLLHDIGHLPFSHVIENNHDIEFKDLTHERIAASHIMGEVRATHFTQYLSKKFGVDNTVPISKLIDDLSKDAETEINKSFISYFITKDKRYVKNGKRISELSMIKELVSGLLDLDRFDHYYRDSVFMGNSLARFNVLSFLDDIILTDHGVKLKGDGIIQALSFLQSKENMMKFSFQNVENLAYETMLNFCISLFVEDMGERGKKNFENEFIFWTDDELLSNLSLVDIPEVRYLIYRIIYKKPYLCLGKFTANSDKVRSAKQLNEIRNGILSELSAEIKEHQLLLRIPRKFKEKVDKEEAWLSMYRLMNLEGKRLADTNKAIRKEVDSWVVEQVRGEEDFWVFVDDDLGKPVRNRIIDKVEKMTGTSNVLEE